MATKGVYFNGKLLTIPGLYATVDSTMNSSKAAVGAKVIGLIGECTGGEPDTVQFFSDPSIAKKVLKSGELLTAMNKAWNPVSKTKTGVTLSGADIIAVIRANKATKGTTGIKQASAKDAAIGKVAASTSATTTGKVTATGDYTGSGNATIYIEVVSSGTTALAETKFNWRLVPDNKFVSDADMQAAANVALGDTGISVAFGDGNYNYGDVFLIPVTAAVKATDDVFDVQSKDWGIDANKIQHKLTTGTTANSKKFVVYDSKNDLYETFDNLGPVFTIKYSGEQTYAAMSIISDGEGNSIKLQTYIGAAEDTAIVDLDIDLDVKTFRTVKSFLSYMSGFENYEVSAVKGYNTALSVHDFDFCEKKAIKTAATVTALLPDLQKTVAEKSNMVEVEIVNRELANVADYQFVALTGGSEGRVPTSWEEYLNMLGRYNISYITPLTDDESIIAECIAHVNNMSDNFGKERRLICGSGNHLSVDEAADKAQLFSGHRVQYVYPGFYDLNDDGETELYPAYILAAQHAGRAAGLPDGESATHDTYRMAGIEYELEPNEITQLLNAGVVTFEFVIAEDSYSSSSVRLVQDITTYTDTNDPLYVERSVGAIADSLNKRIRAAIDDLITGRKTTTGILTSVKNAVISVLQQSMKEPYECIVAYRDVKVYKEGGATYIEYAVAPAEPNNFTLITGHFYSETLSVTDETADNTLE